VKQNIDAAVNFGTLSYAIIATTLMVQIISSIIISNKKYSFDTVSNFQVAFVLKRKGDLQKDMNNAIVTNIKSYHTAWLLVITQNGNSTFSVINCNIYQK